MPRLSPRLRGLLLAALITCTFVIWLASGTTQATGLGQGESPISPNQTPVDQPTATETPVETATPFTSDIPTDTPVPDTPTFLPPTDTPVPDTPTPEPPTDTPTPEPPTDTPTPEPPTSTPTVTVTPTPTPRPVVLPTLTPVPTILDAMGQVVNVALTSAAWIWLTCGSLLFFAVAGAFAGLSFYRQSRQRYELYTIVPEEEDASAPTSGSRRHESDDDSWPSSLP